MSGSATLKHSADVVADVVSKVLEAVRCNDRPSTAAEIGAEHGLLMDLYMAGLLWVKREGGEIAFGVTRLGRRLFAG
ncbi:MAG: hypothetical protein E6R03_12135 [Hyphomicrobiaceae bacterium]|nr:MAG: hypothetical protein E6R03_12135 [Hyphomicrobiaceae bacterium]